MSVTIRLSRIGRKNLPAFKIVVANTRDKRDGRSIDIIGHYNPSMNPVQFEYDKKKFKDWVTKGAMVSEAVDKLVKGEYEFIPYTRQNEKGTQPEIKKVQKDASTHQKAGKQGSALEKEIEKEK